MKKLDFALGQKFRYFIHDNLCNIKLIHEENQDLAYDIMPNDPLMLMDDNYVLGNPNNPGEISPRDNIDCTDTVFEPFGSDEYPDGVVGFSIDYIDPNTYEKKSSNVVLKFSSVKNIFYDKTAIAVKPVWLQLWSIIHTTIQAMYAKNKKTRENARNAKDVESPATEIINEAEKNNEDVDKGEAGEVTRTTSREELEERGKKKLQEQGIENPTDEDVLSYMNNKVNLEYKNLGRTTGLFDYSFSLGNCLVTINMDHIFYKTTLNDLFSSTDVKTAFELFICSLVKAIDETNLNQGDENDNLIATWHEKLRKYINEQQSFAKN